jgi:hypothetical protein
MPEASMHEENHPVRLSNGHAALEGFHGSDAYVEGRIPLPVHGKTSLQQRQLSPADNL